MRYYEFFFQNFFNKYPFKNILLFFFLDSLEVIPKTNTVRRESVRTCFLFQPVGLISQFMFLCFWYGEAFDVIRGGGALCPFEEPDI